MPELTEDQIAERVARDLEDGWYVNLGVGSPLSVLNHIRADLEVMFHSENGILGLGPSPAPGQEDPDIVNAGKQFATVNRGGCFFDSSVSFAIVRGKHLDLAVVGAYQVSQYGDLANWKMPSQKIGGVGGAADLAVGAKRLWVMMSQTTKDGNPKIVKECTFPLTAKRAVSRIYTELAVFDVTTQGLVLRDLSPGLSVEDVARKTGAPFRVISYDDSHSASY